MSEIIPLFEDQGRAGRQKSTAAESAQVMLMLGDFAFSADSTAYQQLSREATWRWGEQERIGRQSLMQYTGKGARTVRLEGQVHAFFGKGVGPLESLFLMGEDARPLQLVSGSGEILGWWVITAFSEVTSRFLPGGGHRNKTWTMTLKYYADNLSEP